MHATEIERAVGRSHHVVRIMKPHDYLKPGWGLGPSRGRPEGSLFVWCDGCLQWNRHGLSDDERREGSITDRAPHCACKLSEGIYCMGMASGELKKVLMRYPSSQHSPPQVRRVYPRHDWLVDGLVERGSRGAFTGGPGKSWAALDLAIAMSLGEPWLGLTVPNPLLVAYVASHDSPELMSLRMRHLFQGHGAKPNGYLRIYTPQSSSAKVDLLLHAIKRIRPEFAVIDPLDEDHEEVLRQLDCSIAIVTRIPADWADWQIGVSVADEQTQTRRVEFQSKVAQSPASTLLRIVTDRHATHLLEDRDEGTSLDRR